MIEFLKKIYYDLYEIPSIYLEIENPIFSHLCNVLIIVIFTLIITLLIKQFKEYLSIRKDNKRIQRNIDKNLVNFFSNKYSDYNNKKK